MAKSRKKPPPPLQFKGAWDYAPAPESTDPVQLNDHYELFIDGKFVPATSSKTFPSLNPATEKTLATVSEASSKDVDRAVRAARKAYEGVWSKTKPAERGKYLFRIARLIQERSRELAILESMDGGKPIRESRDVDLPLVAAHFFHYAGWADKLVSGEKTEITFSYDPNEEDVGSDEEEKGG